MQVLTQPRRKAADFAEPQSAEVDPLVSYQATSKEPSHLTEFIFTQRTIPFEGGQCCLRLLKPLKLQIDVNLRFKVQDWGIEMDCADLPDLPREVARRFLFLLNAAENERLTETDQADWVRISDFIDFRQFTIDRSPPRYQEGTLLRKNEITVVKWHDGSHEAVALQVARALSDVNVGERFAGHVKIGKNDQVIGLERVSLLGPADDFVQKDWTTWPAKG